MKTKKSKTKQRPRVTKFQRSITKIGFSHKNVDAHLEELRRVDAGSRKAKGLAL